MYPRSTSRLLSAVVAKVWQTAVALLLLADASAQPVEFTQGSWTLIFNATNGALCRIVCCGQELAVADGPANSGGLRLPLFYQWTPIVPDAARWPGAIHAGQPLV